MILKSESIIFPEGYEIENRIVRYKHKLRNLQFTFNMERDLEFLCIPLKKFNNDDGFIILCKLRKEALPLKFRNCEDCSIISQFINCQVKFEDGYIHSSSNFIPYSFLYRNDISEKLLSETIEIPNDYIEIKDV